jgi:hypothetical protein
MVNELSFDDNDSLYAMYKANPDAYRALLEKHGIPLHPELVEKAKKTPAVHDVQERKWPVTVAGEGGIGAAGPSANVPSAPVPVAGGEE